MISVGAFQLRTLFGSVNHFQVTARLCHCTRPGALSSAAGAGDACKRCSELFPGSR